MPKDKATRSDSKEELKVAQQFSSPLKALKVRAVKFAEIRKRINERFHKGEYVELKMDLLMYELDPSTIRIFFLKQGWPILLWAVGRTSHSKALRFLFETIDKETLREVLFKQNLSILEDFLRVQYGCEICGLDNEAEKLDRTEKFRIMLAIDRPGIESFIHEKIAKGDECMTEKIRGSFHTAITDLEEDEKKQLAATVPKELSSSYHVPAAP